MMSKLLKLALLALTVVNVDAEPIAIVGATVHTLGPEGRLVDATVLIEADSIVAVGTDIVIPPAARRIDATGKIVTPGLFDSYSYLGVHEITLVEETVDAIHTGDHLTAAFDVRDAVNPRSTLIAINRVEGVTRVMVAPRSAHEADHIIAGLGATIDLGGGTAYADDTRRAMFVTLGEAGARLAGGSRAAALLLLREALQDAADYVANRDAYNERSRREYALSRLDLDALAAVLAKDMPLAVTVERASDIEAVLRLAAEFAIDLVVVGGSEAWLVAAQLAASGTPVVIDPLQNLPERFEQIGAHLENAARLSRAGVVVAFKTGGPSGSHNARNLRQAAGNAVAHGLPYEEALRALTVNPARIYRLDDRYGTLEAGKVADVVIWSGDPLEVTSYAEQVFIAGTAVSMQSRATLLRDRYLKSGSDLPPAYR